MARFYCAQEGCYDRQVERHKLAQRAGADKIIRIGHEVKVAEVSQSTRQADVANLSKDTEPRTIPLMNTKMLYAGTHILCVKLYVAVEVPHPVHPLTQEALCSVSVVVCTDVQND